MENHNFLRESHKLSMALFNSYTKLPEGIWDTKDGWEQHPEILFKLIKYV